VHQFCHTVLSQAVLLGWNRLAFVCFGGIGQVEQVVSLHEWSAAAKHTKRDIHIHIDH
jgi:hypothetical protein